MGTVQLPPDFKEFLRLLNSNNVRYLLVGGYAVGYHGYPRATVDIDIWIDIDESNAQKVYSALMEFGFDIPELSIDTFRQKDKIIRMGVPPLRIELITSASGVEFEECYNTMIADELDGIPVNIISLEHLKKNKKAAGRHKDLADIENLP